MNLSTKIAIVLSIIASIPIIFLDIFEWDLLDRYTVFGMVFYELLAWLIIFIAIISTFIFFVWIYKKHQNVYSIIPFAIVLTVFLVTTSGLPAKMAQYINFYKNYNARMEVVRKIESEKLYINLNQDTIRLPSKYKYLSSGDEVIVAKESGKVAILFYFFRGFDSYSGFIYKQNNKAPFSGDYFQPGGLHYSYIQKLKPHWFLVSGT